MKNYNEKYFLLESAFKLMKLMKPEFATLFYMVIWKTGCPQLNVNFEIVKESLKH